MELLKNEVHIWSFALKLTMSELTDARQLLSIDELERADRFHFALHRERFIAAHSILRRILAEYLMISPADITYQDTEHGKPILANSSTINLQFNLSHSEDMGTCAITLDQAIGIDIEKMQADAKQALAKRYFSEAEYDAMMAVDGQQRIDLFFAIWTRKEAVLKATGKGLTIPLNQFTVPLDDQPAPLQLDGATWQLIPFILFPAYQSALAIAGSTHKLTFWSWEAKKYTLLKEQVL